MFFYFGVFLSGRGCVVSSGGGCGEGGSCRPSGFSSRITFPTEEGGTPRESSSVRRSCNSGFSGSMGFINSCSRSTIRVPRVSFRSSVRAPMGVPSRESSHARAPSCNSGFSSRAKRRISGTAGSFRCSLSSSSVNGCCAGSAVRPGHGGIIGGGGEADHGITIVLAVTTMVYLVITIIFTFARYDSRGGSGGTSASATPSARRIAAMRPAARCNSSGCIPICARRPACRPPARCRPRARTPIRARPRARCRPRARPRRDDSVDIARSSRASSSARPARSCRDNNSRPCIRRG